MYNKKEKTEQLTAFCEVLKENGFDVLRPLNPEYNTWIKIHKDGNFGSICCSNYSGFDFNTVHKPCRECGTGYVIETETDITIENAKKTLIFAPNWATSKDIKAIKKYKDINDFLSSTHNKWANYQVI